MDNNLIKWIIAILSMGVVLLVILFLLLEGFDIGNISIGKTIHINL